MRRLRELRKLAKSGRGWMEGPYLGHPSWPAREVYPFVLLLFLLELETDVFCELLKACSEILTLSNSDSECQCSCVYVIYKYVGLHNT